MLQSVPARSEKRYIIARKHLLGYRVDANL